MNSNGKSRAPGRAMRVVDLVHRWTGGLVGLLLAIMGLSGTLLLHENLLIRATVAHATDPVSRDDARLAAVATRFLNDPASGVQSIRFGGNGIGVHRLFYKSDGGGAYVDQAGRIVTRWTSEWQRPEVWLFNIHHHFLLGEAGTTLVGIVGLAGFGFVVTGILLWWRTRSTFSLRVLPERASRPSIVRHHRDLGVVVAPLLLLSFVTGVMMTLKPVEAVLLAPFGPPRGSTPPRPPARLDATAPRAPVDWPRLFRETRTRFPDADLRWAGLPSRNDPRVQIRLRQPGEWTPNGRTLLLFDGGGHLVQLRDAVHASLSERARNAEYPLHMGAALPIVGTWLLTLSGLALTMLGTLAVWTFWFASPRPPRRPAARRTDLEELTA